MKFLRCSKVLPPQSPHLQLGYTNGLRRTAIGNVVIIQDTLCILRQFLLEEIHHPVKLFRNHFSKQFRFISTLKCELLLANKFTGSESQFGVTWNGETWAHCKSRYIPRRHLLTLRHLSLTRIVSIGEDVAGQTDRGLFCG